MNTEDTPPTPDHPKERRRRSPLLVASMAAAVLLAGGGAAYWASSASGDEDSGPGSAGRADPPPLALDGYTGGSIAAGEPNPQGAKYKAVKELPGGPSSAPVYRPQGEISRESVERLAKALDVAGKVRSEGTTWKVGGTRDARSPVLQVNKTGSGSWTYSQYGTPGGTNCALPAGPENGKDGDQAGAGASSRPGCPSYRGGGDITTEDDSSGKGAVSPEKAKQAVRPVLKALGQESARLDASGLSGAVRIVTANPVLGGLPTYGWQSDLQVGSDGQVVGGSGQLANPVKGAVYPVLSADKTLARLNTGGGRTPAGCPSVPPGKDGKDGKDGKGGQIAPCEPSPTKAQKPAEVTGAVFGLAVQYVSGGQALVPSWLYTVRQPGAGSGPDATTTVAHPAVDPKYLAHKDRTPKGPSGKPGAMALESYDVGDGGRKLTVHFWGGVCSVYSVSAEESDTTVKTKVVGKDKKPGQVCVKIAKEFTKTVTLREPLDGRKVIDVSTGEAVPKR
ncbi:hypothetical protein ACGFOU_23340 [Streptomyces sp. NPDC048595]|uniref:hypothetical protein n=1 Tax=Streptomyces sp. NPDC048595 TaxID=3365576 RepID=UPI00371B88DA